MKGRVHQENKDNKGYDKKKIQYFNYEKYNMHMSVRLKKENKNY